MKIQSPFVDGKHEINFVFREARKKCSHLLVIFTSIRSELHWLDFDMKRGLLESNRSNILWIQDDINGQYSYYSAISKDFSVEDSVAALIEKVRNSLGLPVENCTAAGMSKGASAALRLGIRCNFGNIVALVPRIAIGSYLLHRERYNIISHMTGAEGKAEVEWLDNLVPQSLQQDLSNRRNIYLITSPYDVYCVDYLPNIISRLRMYDNFNLVSTSSDLARTHIQTLKYNVPFMVSLLGLLSENLPPIFGETSNGEGLSGTGHRDNHPLQGRRFGGTLPLDDLRSSATLVAEVTESTARMDSAEARLDAIRSSRLGRLQLFVWRTRHWAKSRSKRNQNTAGAGGHNRLDSSKRLP